MPLKTTLYDFLTMVIPGFLLLMLVSLGFDRLPAFPCNGQYMIWVVKSTIWCEKAINI